ncbi:MAG: PQ-loop repeat-containing protein [Legionellaceae bacterium]|nr:PQ-loop repeat-containing protein [Legionellaceae bacterium]
MMSISPTTLGNLTLNIAFVLYLIVYVPQIRHNKNKHHLAELSISLHMLIMTSFVLDLLYALFKPLPWQYRAVSIAALSTLSIQQFQLMRFAQERGQIRLLAVLSLFSVSLISILMLLGFFYFDAMAHSSNTILLIGWVSRVGFLSYIVPQIIKNYRMSSAKALSTSFLALSLFLSLLDLTSAWCLDWGWPNKLGTPLTITLTLMLLWQKKRYA